MSQSVEPENAPRPREGTFAVRLVSARPLTPTVRELTFEREDGNMVEFEAGHWVFLDLPTESGTVRRAYSLASAPPREGARNRFELAVTRVDGGPGSTSLHTMEVGTVIPATAPQGFFVRKERTPALFVATGSGMTPLRSMILDALATGDSSPLQLICGVRTPDERLYADDFAKLSESFPQLRVSYTLSRAEESWTGPRGYVQTHVRKLYEELASGSAAATTDGAPVAPHVYICGLQKMVTAVREVLRKEMDLPRQVVHSERFD